MTINCQLFIQFLKKSVRWAFVSIVVFTQTSVHAKDFYQCTNSDKVSTTIYYVPSRKQFSSDKAFKKAVRLQGTGSLGNGKVLRYNGKIQKLPKGCNTAVGAAGRCLMPFFSIAADLRYYRAGDIISIPEIRGKMVTLPDGKKIKHPGYFIVDDTGQAIKGKGRFDFFTGDMHPRSKTNTFGFSNQKLKMTDKRSCDKSFQVIRRESIIQRNKWDLALTEMSAALGSQSSAHRLLAKAKSSLSSTIITAQAENHLGAQK